MIRYLYLVIFALLSQVVLAQSFTPAVDTSMWITDGTVETLVKSGNTIYLGGRFTTVGPYTGSGVKLDTNSGLIQGASLKINGTVRASMADGTGGWYIGGDFKSVAGVSRNCIAHILPNNTLDLNWNPNVSNGSSSNISLLSP